MKAPTPRTDKVAEYIANGGAFSALDAHARELERELRVLALQNAALLKDRERLRWLHTGGGSGARKEWGVAEVEFDANGKVIGALWGFSDSSDIDKAMAEEFADEDPNLRMNQPDIHGSGGHGG